MSRNLCEIECARCSGPVRMTSDTYRLPPDHFSCPRMEVADAECSVCHAQYTAWVGRPDLSESRGPGYHEFHWRAEGFYDLSFRSTFNDEPGPDDLPNNGEFKSWRVITCNGKEVYRKELGD